MYFPYSFTPKEVLKDKIMPAFDVVVDNERRLVIVTATGELFQKEGEEIITAARKKAAESNYNILYDIRNATTTVAFASWYKLPRELDVFKDRKSRLLKAAILASPSDKAVKDYKFYELVTENLGLKIRVFFEENEAIEWLNDDSSGTSSNIFWTL